MYYNTLMYIVCKPLLYYNVYYLCYNFALVYAIMCIYPPKYTTPHTVAAPWPPQRSPLPPCPPPASISTPTPSVKKRCSFWGKVKGVSTYPNPLPLCTIMCILPTYTYITFYAIYTYLTLFYTTPIKPSLSVKRTFNPHIKPTPI
jgi:hypothetical protein